MDRTNETKYPMDARDEQIHELLYKRTNDGTLTQNQISGHTNLSKSTVSDLCRPDGGGISGNSLKALLGCGMTDIVLPILYILTGPDISHIPTNPDVDLDLNNDGKIDKDDVLPLAAKLQTNMAKQTNAFAGLVALIRGDSELRHGESLELNPIFVEARHLHEVGNRLFQSFEEQGQSRKQAKPPRLVGGGA